MLDGLRDHSLTVNSKPFRYAIIDSATGKTKTWNPVDRRVEIHARRHGDIFKVQGEDSTLPARNANGATSICDAPVNAIGSTCACAKPTGGQQNFEAFRRLSTCAQYKKPGAMAGLS